MLVAVYQAASFPARGRCAKLRPPVAPRPPGSHAAASGPATQFLPGRTRPAPCSLNTNAGTSFEGKFIFPALLNANFDTSSSRPS